MDKENRVKKDNKWQVDKLKKTNEIYREEKKALSFDKKSTQSVGNVSDRTSSIEVKKAKPKIKELNLKEVNLKDMKRPPMCPNKYKNKKVEMRGFSKGYWDSNPNS
jgi:hypothetical protein